MASQDINHKNQTAKPSNQTVVYRIRDYQKTFENSKTLELKNLQWVPIPNDQDSLGYRRLMRMEGGPMAYLVFIELVKLASRQPLKYDRKGWLTSDGYPPSTDSDGNRQISTIYGVDDLADKIMFDEAHVKDAIDILSSAKINWLTVENIEPVENRQKSSEIVSEGNCTELNCTVPDTCEIASTPGTEPEPHHELTPSGVKLSDDDQSPKPSKPKSKNPKPDPLAQHPKLDAAYPKIIDAMEAYGHRGPDTAAAERKWRDTLRKCIEVDNLHPDDVTAALLWIFSSGYIPDPNFSWADQIRSLAGIRNDRGNGKKIDSIIGLWRKFSSAKIYDNPHAGISTVINFREPCINCGEYALDTELTNAAGEPLGMRDTPNWRDFCRCPRCGKDYGDDIVVAARPQNSELS